MMPRRDTSPELAPHRFSVNSWIALTLSLIFIVLSLMQVVYRLSLPWDGWSFYRDATGSGQQLIFARHLVAGSSPLQTGDVLLSVQGQTFDDMLVCALTWQPERPSNGCPANEHRRIQRGGFGGARFARTESAARLFSFSAFVYGVAALDWDRNLALPSLQH